VLDLGTQNSPWPCVAWLGFVILSFLRLLTCGQIFLVDIDIVNIEFARIRENC